MFLQNSQRKIEEEFLKLTEKFGADREPLKTICEKLDGCGRDLGLAMKYLYVTAPYSDLVNYTFEEIQDFASHGLFLYNTLDTIVWLIESNEPDEAVTMVVTLSDFFREILSKGKEFISIKEEEKHISSYLQIQEMRYRDILEYDIQLDQVIYKYQILKLTLQPVVENALYHGIKYKRAKGCIHIHGEKEGDIIRLTVRDDGVGMDEEELEQLRQQIEKPCQETEKGFGLANVNERIHMYFGPEYGMKIQSQKGKGTTVEIVIPAILEAPVEKTGNDTAKVVEVGNSVNSDANKKIKSNPKQQNANKIIEGGQPQQEETGV